MSKTPTYVLGLCGASYAINASFFLMVYIHRESKNCKLAERQQKHGMQNWRSCTVVDISNSSEIVTIDNYFKAPFSNNNRSSSKKSSNNNNDKEKKVTNNNNKCDIK